MARHPPARHCLHRELDRRRRHIGVGRIIDVASPVAAVERRAVVAAQRQFAPEPFGQVGVGDELATERDEICVACRDYGRGTLSSKTAGCDQGTAEFSPKVLGSDRSLAFDDLLDALDPRLDHVEVGDAQPIKLSRDIAKGRGRVAVRHRSVGAARRDADADAIGSPDRDCGLRDLQEEARAVFNGAAIFIRTLVGAVLEELIGQVAVRAVESRRHQNQPAARARRQRETPR